MLGVLALYFAGREDVREYIDLVYEGSAEVFMCEVNVVEFPIQLRPGLRFGCGNGETRPIT